MAYIKDKFSIKRYLTHNRLGIWYYALVHNDDDKEFWKCVKIVIKDRSNNKIMKSTSVPGLVNIPQHVRDKAQEEIEKRKKPEE